MARRDCPGSCALVQTTARLKMTAASTTALFAKVRLPMPGSPGARRLPGCYGGFCIGTVFYTSNHISFYYSISFIDGLVIFAEKDL